VALHATLGVSKTTWTSQPENQQAERPCEPKRLQHANTHTMGSLSN
jgi:hypothetical protein